MGNSVPNAVRLGLSQFFVVVGALFLAGCDLAGFADFYIMDTEYRSMEAVHEDGAILRGWIPAYLPPTVEHLQERHSLDTNEGWAYFRCGAIDRTFFDAHWRPVRAAPLPRDPNRFRGEPAIDWWPERFGDGYAYYMGVEAQGFWLAIDFETGQGYFWQNP